MQCPQSDLPIKVLKIKRLRGDGPLKAIADLQVGDWSIFNWLIVQHNGSRIQVFYPKTAWVGPGQQIRYRALLSIPKALRQRVEIAVITAWEKETNNEFYPQNPR